MFSQVVKAREIWINWTKRSIVTQVSCSIAQKVRTKVYVSEFTILHSDGARRLHSELPWSWILSKSAKKLAKES